MYKHRRVRQGMAGSDDRQLSRLTKAIRYSYLMDTNDPLARIVRVIPVTHFSSGPKQKSKVDYSALLDEAQDRLYDPLARLVKIVPVVEHEPQQPKNQPKNIFSVILDNSKNPKPKAKPEGTFIKVVSEDKQPENLAEKSHKKKIGVQTHHEKFEIKIRKVEPEPTQTNVQPIQQALAVVQEAATEPAKHQNIRSTLSKLAKFKYKRYIAGATAVVLVAVIGLSSVINNPKKQDVLGARSISNQANIDTDEVPVVLTVTDPSKLTQPYLKNSEYGDKVYLYYLAKKAVLYRPSSSSVIAMTDFIPPPAKVFVRIGADKPELDTVLKSLNEVENITLDSRDTSPNAGYAKTVVVDISGRYPYELKSIASELGAQQTAMPTGESVPDADIMIIVGKAN